MRRANGQGTIVKLAGNRRRPYAVKRITGWKENGVPTYKYLSYHKTYREAERALNRYNEDPYSLTSKTLKQVYEEWLELQKDRAEGTIKAYESGFKYLEPLHNMKMADIDRLTLQAFYDGLGGTKSRADKVKKLLNNLIKYSVRKGIMPMSASNLHKAIDLSDIPEGNRTERKVIPREVIDKLWKMTDQEIVKQILLYIYTGCRWSELHDLQPENCYPDHIEIIAAKTDAGVRDVPLCDKIKSILPVEPIPSYDVFNKYFHEILPDHRIHDTRHTFITMLTEAGIDARIIKSIVGHKGSDITEYYTHITLEAKLEAVNSL